MKRRVIAIVAVVASLVTAGLLAAAPAAIAGLPVVASGNIGITFTATTFTVCAAGGIDQGGGTAGTWELEIDGVRTDGTTLHEAFLAPGETFPLRCFTYPKNANTDGAFATTLAFATVGSGSVGALPEFTAVAGGEGSWNPDNSNSFST